MKLSLKLSTILLIISFRLFPQTLNTNNFQDGEHITYVVSYNWFVIWTEVGEVLFTVKNAKIGNKPCLHLLGQGNTYPSWDWFFKVRDRYESWVNPETLKPYYFKRKVREGGYEIDIKYLFNGEKGYALSSYIVNKKPEQKDTLFIPDSIYDVMSALYYARTLDYSVYKPEEIIPVKLVLDRQLENIYFRYKGIENIKIRKVGEFECIKLSVLLVAGSVFKGGESMTIWITNDKNKIPVYIETPIIIGSVKAKLKAYDGLKYPLNSKID